MALVYKFLLLCFLLIFVPPAIAQTSFRPRALVLPVQKNAAVFQYVTQIKQRTPLVPVKLAVHLGGNLLWVDCEKGYVSSTNKTARCGSAQCNLIGPVACGGGICGEFPSNPISNTGTFGSIRIDVVSVQSTNGRHPGRGVTVNTEGGFLGTPSNEYFIVVKSIKVGGKAIPLNTTLLSIDSEGIGGTKFSTAVPYTVLETSIYKALLQAFVNAMPTKVIRVAPVAPFGACFNSRDIGSSRLGPSVPQIDLVLQNSKVLWSIIGANSIVRVSNDVSCLGFVDGGVTPKTSIVIGGHQLDNNLVQFDIATSRLGFSNSLLLQRTMCSNFNFTST